MDRGGQRTQRLHRYGIECGTNVGVYRRAHSVSRVHPLHLVQHNRVPFQVAGETLDVVLPSPGPQADLPHWVDLVLAVNSGFKNGSAVHPRLPLASGWQRAGRRQHTKPPADKQDRQKHSRPCISFLQGVTQFRCPSHIFLPTGRDSSHPPSANALPNPI